MEAPPSSSTASDPKLDLVRQMRSHEVAVAELSNLSATRAVYQKTGNLFFRTTVQKAKTFEQKQLDLVRSKLDKVDSQ